MVRAPSYPHLEAGVGPREHGRSIGLAMMGYLVAERCHRLHGEGVGTDLGLLRPSPIFMITEACRRQLPAGFRDLRWRLVDEHLGAVRHAGVPDRPELS